MKKISKSAAQTRKIGAEFARGLVGAIRESPLLVGLFGDLGAGKTTFVQGMAQGCGIDPDYYVNSPTFTLINEYVSSSGHPPIRMIHVDLYRIDKPIEGQSLALEEYFQPGCMIVVEWPEKWPEFMKELDFEVRIETVSDKNREIKVVERR